MKKILGGFALSILLAAPVAAADMRMPVKAPPPPVITVFSWTGCYIGGHVGYAWGKKRVYQDGVQIDELNHNVDGFIAGGQIGCNLWQNDRWVFGIEGQASWADVKGDAPDPGQTFLPPGFRTEIDILGSISARFGYAFGATGQTLVFIKGGAAFVHEQYFTVSSAILANNNQTDEHLRWGWMVGAGVEQALSSNWSVKAEYNFNHFGTKTHEFCNEFGSCTDLGVRQRIHLVKFGLNYRFGGFGGPVVARY